MHNKTITIGDDNTKKYNGYTRHRSPFTHSLTQRMKTMKRAKKWTRRHQETDRSRSRRAKTLLDRAFPNGDQFGDDFILLNKY
jgi:hypothetical protein